MGLSTYLSTRSWEMISIILSILRLIATAGIFLFHILGIYNLNNKYIDFISILIFCFLSGFLGAKVDVQPHKWIVKRFFSIMIPYWLIIIPVVIINRIIHYKNTTIFMDLITIAGGNLFLKNPVYVIAWYITFVLLLYLFLYIKSISRLPEIFIWPIGYYIIGYFFNKDWYFISFAFGYLLSRNISYPIKSIRFETRIGLILFDIQKHCYSFFLVHGGIILFLYHILKMSMLNSIIWGILLSSFFVFFGRKNKQSYNYQID